MLPPSRLEPEVDLADRYLSHRSIVSPFCQQAQCHPLIASAGDPLQWGALAGEYLERLAVDRHRLLKPDDAALAPTQRPEREAENRLRRRPLERYTPRVYVLRASRQTVTASSSWAEPLSRSPMIRSALPRLFSALAQSRGTRSRVNSFRASRKATTASSIELSEQGVVVIADAGDQRDPLLGRHLPAPSLTRRRAGLLLKLQAAVVS